MIIHVQGAIEGAKNKILSSCKCHKNFVENDYKLLSRNYRKRLNHEVLAWVFFIIYNYQ